MFDPAIEADIRIQAFAFLKTATERYGDVLSWSVLTQGFRYRGEPVPLIGQRGIWKPRVFTSVPFSITTAPPRPGRPAPYDDGMDAQGRLAYRYQGTDPKHPDNIGLRQALIHAVPLAYFFGIDRGEYLATWPVFIVADDPSRLTFSVSIDDQTLIGTAPTAAASLASEARREYVTTVTLRRLHQQKFRSRVIKAYRSRCAVCRLKHVELLDAAHILPDSDPRGEPIVPNGLSLCKIHHAAFDRHILGITPDLTVAIREDILHEVDGPMLKYGLQAMNGAQILVPRDSGSRPREDLVEARYEQFLAAR